MATPSLTIPFSFTDGQSRVIEIALVVLGIVAGLLYLLPMKSAAGMIGFPIDDAWLQVTFAHNLREFGSYSFFRNEMVTSGSSSPLTVFLVALASLLVHNEETVTMAVGIIAFALTLPVVFRIGRHMFHEEQWLALAAAAAVLLVPKMQSAAVSGMGTPVYTLLLAIAMLLFLRRSHAAFFPVAALAVWAAPDGLVLVSAGLFTLLLERRIIRRSPQGAPAAGIRRIVPAAIAVALLAGWFIFNRALGGGIFPNAVPAKIAYYAKLQTPGFPGQLFVFFAGPVLGVLLVPALMELAAVAVRLVRRTPSPMLLPAVYLAAAIVAYWIFLPYLVDGGRGMLPAVPCFVLLSIAGLRTTFRALLRTIPLPGMRAVGNAASFAVVAGVVLSGVLRWSAARTEHYTGISYMRERSVAAAAWVAQNTAPDAVIATHLPGAFGRFGERRVLDFSGLVSPEIIPNMGDLNALGALFDIRNTSYIASLRERFEVVNTNPAFTSDPKTPEVMEVTPYVKKVTHIMPQPASSLNYQASLYLQQRKAEPAIELLRRSYQLDPASSRTLTLTGLAVLLQKDTAQALQLLDEALKLQPDYAPAMTPIADIFIEKGNIDGAVEMLQKSVQLNPRSQNARNSLQKALFLQMKKQGSGAAN